MQEFIAVSNEDLIVNAGLYEKFEFSYDSYENLNKFINLLLGELKVDCYCKKCDNIRTFKHYKISKTKERDLKTQNFFNIINDQHEVKDSIEFLKCIIELDYFSVKLYCTREEYHVIDIIFKVTQEESNKFAIMKIGQYPSIADLAVYDIRKYKKYISNEDFLDLNRAIGLSAHGVGAGAFVYLRRIFENFVKEAYEACLNEGKWDESINFYRTEMKDKIDKLQEYLPSFLFKNKIIYGILSAGIHSLDENYCKDNFEILKEAILVILDEKRAKKEEEERKVRLEKHINKINSEVAAMNKCKTK